MPVRRRKVRFFDAFTKAVSQCPDCSSENKLRLRLALAFNRDARISVQSFIEEKASEENIEGFGDLEAGIDLDNLERFMELIVTWLPQILEIILPLFM